jgi:hypothetical protein
MNGKKIQITVPDGYDFVQDGLDIKFVKKSNSKWEEKDSKVVGGKYCCAFLALEQRKY